MSGKRTQDQNMCLPIEYLSALERAKVCLLLMLSCPWKRLTEFEESRHKDPICTTIAKCMAYQAK